MPSESHQSALSPTYLVWLSGRRWICECSWLWSIARLFYVLVCLRHWSARINIQDLSRTWFAEIWSDWMEIKIGRPWVRTTAATFSETDSTRISRKGKKWVQPINWLAAWIWLPKRVIWWKSQLWHNFLSVALVNKQTARKCAFKARLHSEKSRKLTSSGVSVN